MNMCIDIILITNRIKRARKYIKIVLWLSFLLPGIITGQENSDADNDLQGVQQNLAPVKVDGRFLFYVRGISSYSSNQRANTISKRIEKAAANLSISADSVKIIGYDSLNRIFAGEEFIMNVYDADAKVEGTDKAVLANLFQQKILVAIDSYRYERSRPALIKNSLYALGAAFLLTVTLFILFWLIRRLNKRLESRIKIKIDSVDNKSFNLIRSYQLWKAFHVFFKTLKIVVIVVILAVFLQYILGLFPWTSSVATYTLNLFLNPILKISKSFLNFLPSLAFLIVIFLLTRYLLRLIKMLFTGVSQGGILIKGFDPDWAMTTYKILTIFVIAFAVIVAYPYIPGSDSSAFKGVSVFLGVLFSLGSSSFISNVIAGYSMTYRSAFKKGDRINVDGQVGFVEEQKLLVTRLRSVKNEEIVIPNSVLLNSNITNYSSRAKKGGLILHTTVGIGYETPWRQVDAMLKLAADRTEGLLKDPPPFVLQQSLGDFAVNYEINVYCNDVSKMHLYYSALHQNILDIFNENSVQIMTPAYEADPATPKVVPKEQWNTPLANET
jgi:small-conductance mechanosensitive channel